MTKNKMSMELRLTNDDGGTMVIRTKCSVNELLDRLFYWMSRGWYLDTSKM